MTFQNEDLVFHNGNYKEVTISCEDDVQIKTNTFLLSSISPWLYSLIMEQRNQQEISIFFPDIQSENVINLIETVETIINKNTVKTLLKLKTSLTILLEMWM